MQSAENRPDTEQNDTYVQYVDSLNVLEFGKAQTRKELQKVQDTARVFFSRFWN